MRMAGGEWRGRICKRVFVLVKEVHMHRQGKLGVVIKGVERRGK